MICKPKGKAVKVIIMVTVHLMGHDCNRERWLLFISCIGGRRLGGGCIFRGGMLWSWVFVGVFLSIIVLFCFVFCCLSQDKSKLQMYVIASGLTYGIGEGIFHFLFKVRKECMCASVCE